MYIDHGNSTYTLYIDVYCIYMLVYMPIYQNIYTCMFVAFQCVMVWCFRNWKVCGLATGHIEYTCWAHFYSTNTYTHHHIAVVQSSIGTYTTRQQDTS